MYVTAFFNGDLKLFDTNNTEKICVSNLHEDKIEDVLYLKHDKMNYLISCSMEPYPELKIS